MSGLGNIWSVAKEGIGSGVMDFFGGEIQEAELGADIDLSLIGQNFRPDMKEAAVDVKTMIENPVETGKAVVDVSGGAWRKMLKTFMPKGVMDALESFDEMVGYDSSPNEKIATDAWAEIVKTHGSIPAFKKWAQEHPFQAMLELTGAGLVARQVKNVTAPVVAKAIENAELATSRVMMGIENANDLVDKTFPPAFAGVPLTVWHGSDASFTRFNTKFMGSGEGAQAYGWGVYHAQEKRVARGYEGDDDWLEDNQRRMHRDAQDRGDYLEMEMWENALDYDSPSDSLAYMLDAYKDKPNFAEIEVKLKDIHAQWQEDYATSTARRYKVDLPDKAIATMLDDELPVYDQPQVVRDFLRKEHGAYMDGVMAYKPLQERYTKIRELLGDESLPDAKRNELLLESKAVGEARETLLADIMSMDSNIPHPSNGEAIYNWLVTREITQNGIPASELRMDSKGIRNEAVEKIISQRLDANGIKGRTYFDADTKDGMNPGKETRNFVTFNADTSKILEANDVKIDNTKSKIIWTPNQDVDIGMASRTGDIKKLESGLLDQFGHVIVGEELVNLPNKSIFDYEGFPWIASQSDLTRAGGALSEVGGQKLAELVEMLGGQDFMALPNSVKNNLIWASANTPINKLVDAAKTAKDAFGKDPLYLPFAMKPTGMDFSKQVTETMIQAALANLTPKQIAMANKQIRKDSKLQPPTPEGQPKPPIQYINTDFEGIETKNILDGTTGDQRKEIARILDRDFRKEGGQLTKKSSAIYDANSLGSISLPQARIANTDPYQTNKEALTLRNVGIVDTDNAFRKVSGHPTYPNALGGTADARLKENLSLLDIFDNTKAPNKQGKVLPMTRDNFTDDDYRKTNMQATPTGLLTYERLRHLEDQKARGLLDF